VSSDRKSNNKRSVMKRSRSDFRPKKRRRPKLRRKRQLLPRQREREGP